MKTWKQFLNEAKKSKGRKKKRVAIANKKRVAAKKARRIKFKMKTLSARHQAKLSKIVRGKLK